MNDKMTQWELKQKARVEQTSLFSTQTDVDTELKKLNGEIQRCESCELHKLDINKFEQMPGRGKLVANHECSKIFTKTILFLGLSPSYRRFDVELRAMKGVDLRATLNTAATTGDLFGLCLKESGLTENNIWITNILKCSTIDNTKAIDEQYTWCRQWLAKEIELISPDMIVFLGNDVYAKAGYLEKDFKTIKVWHPSYVMRDKIRLREYLTQLKKIKEMIEE